VTTYPYLDHGWFAAVRRVIGEPERPSGLPSIRVQFEIDDVLGPSAHSMEFDRRGIVSWRRGRFEEMPADLVVRRSAELDRGDLLARVASDIEGSTYSAPSIPFPATDVFGMPAELRREVVWVPAGLRIGFVLSSSDTPQGAADGHYEVRGSVVVRRDPLVPSELVMISAPYAAVIPWLHLGGYELGPLLMAGQVTGAIERISALSGVVSELGELPTRSEGAEQRLSDMLLRYHALRSAPNVIEAFDAIDAFTDP